MSNVNRSVGLSDFVGDLLPRGFRVGLCLASIAGLLVACGGGGGGGAGRGAPNPPPPPPVADASPSGVWTGTSPDDIFDRVNTLIVAENGSFRFVDTGANQGTGILSVSDGTSLAGSFKYGRPLGETLGDGSLIMNCTLGGTIAEHVSMSLNVNCVTPGGATYPWTLQMTYVNTYERESSLPIIAGNYQDVNAVLSIAGDGSFFSQDPVTSCVVNGQVSIIDSDFNAYAVEYMHSDCAGDHETLNGDQIMGLATLDNSGATEVLSIFATAEGGNAIVSLVQYLERL